MILPEGPITENIGFLAVLFKDKADGVVCADFNQVDHGRFDVVRIDLRPIALFRQIALCQYQSFQKTGFDTLDRKSVV